MARIDFDLDMVTREGLKNLVKQLLKAQDGEEKEILNKLNAKKSDEEKESNDLADLDEEMHGKHNAPPVTEDDVPRKGLADIPKGKKKNV
jgi:hypothetical protein